MKSILKAFASLKLTVVLMAASILLVFFSTLAQRLQGIWTVVGDYFRSWFVMVDLQIFFPMEVQTPGSFPFPGGFLVGTLLMINLIAAHSVTFKVKGKGWRLITGCFLLSLGIGSIILVAKGMLFQEQVASTAGDANWRVIWRLAQGLLPAFILLFSFGFLFQKRAAVVLLHFGIFLLFAAELITAVASVEGTMSLREGDSSNYIDHSFDYELAIIDRSHSAYDETLAVPAAKLQNEGSIVQEEQLPFDIKVERYINNTHTRFFTAQETAVNFGVNAGIGTELLIKEREEHNGLTSQRNAPALVATLIDKKTKKELGTYLFSIMHYSHFFSFQSSDIFQRVEVDGKVYDLMLRNEREYLFAKGAQNPFTVTLNDFRHDKYIGTNTPSNFSSLIKLEDKDKGIERLVNIWMNNPMRYAGRTFYQSGFTPDNKGSILQVMKNGGWMLPYIALMIVGLGMFIHFCITFISFIEKERK